VATCRVQLGATEGATVRGIIRPAGLMTCFSIVTLQMLAFLVTPVLDANATKRIPVANDVHSIVLLIQSTTMQVISALRSQETSRALPATAVTDLLTLVRLDSKSLHCLAIVMSASSWQMTCQGLHLFTCLKNAAGASVCELISDFCC
jgi:hypothetical protein